MEKNLTRKYCWFCDKIESLSWYWMTQILIKQQLNWYSYFSLMTKEFLEFMVAYFQGVYGISY